MANKLYEENSIRDIASAIREKNGTANTYNVSEMGDAVRAITTGDGSITPTGTINITTNGTHDVTQYASASVNVQAESSGIIPSGDITITENGRFDVTNYAGAVVNVPSGGGGAVDLPSNIKTGTFTVLADTIEPQVVVHNAGSMPIGVLVMIDELSNPDGIKTKTIGGLSLGRNEAVVFNNTGKMAYGAVTCITEITESTFTLNPRGETFPFSSQLTYRWWVWI